MVFMIWEFFYFEVKVGVLLVFRIIWNDYWEFFLQVYKRYLIVLWYERFNLRFSGESRLKQIEVIWFLRVKYVEFEEKCIFYMQLVF